jgi:Zn-dependent M32 family carboxypeptidase
MGEKTHTSESDEIKRTDEKADLRKHRKRITTNEEIAEIMENRKKYQEEDLKQKMARISKQQKEDGRIIGED